MRVPFATPFKPLQKERHCNMIDWEGNAPSASTPQSEVSLPALHTVDLNLCSQPRAIFENQPKRKEDSKSQTMKLLQTC